MIDTNGLPWEPVPGREGIEVIASVSFAKEVDGSRLQHETTEEKTKQPRAVYINKADVKRYGMTPGCDGYLKVNRGEDSSNRSDQCRLRIEKLMSEEQVPKFEKAMKRLAEHALKEEKIRSRGSKQQVVRGQWMIQTGRTLLNEFRNR